MRALSYSQPWLWAVFDQKANKDVENRLGYQAPMDLIDQPMAAHAAKSYDDNGLHRLLELDLDPPQEFVKSAIIGVHTIDRIVTSPKTLTPEQRGWYMGDENGMRDGKTVFGHVLKDRRLLPKPITWDGQLGFWQVPPLIEAEINYQLGEQLPYVAQVIHAATAKLKDYAVGATHTDRLARYVEINPGVHLWFEAVTAKGYALVSCVACGKLRPPNPSNAKPCKGVVKLTVRNA